MRHEQFAQVLESYEMQEGQAKDGGYAFASALTHFDSCLPEPGRKEFRRYLLHLVATQHPKWWGVALETLVQIGEQDDAEQLAELARTGAVPKDMIISAVLRMRPLALSDWLWEEIRHAEKRGEDKALWWLVPYSLINHDTKIINFLAKVLVRWMHEKATAESLASFSQFLITLWLPEASERLLWLLEAIHALDESAWARFRKVLLQELGRPWLETRYGEEVLERVRKGVARE